MCHEMLEYVQINHQSVDPERDESYRKNMLCTEAETVTFPLSEEVKRDLALIEAQFDHEDNMAGLAAPQVGIKRKIIVLSAPEDEELKRWRPDHEQILPKTVLINPSYEPLDEEMHEDYEACFSVHEMAGLVPRYKRIKYRGFDPEGNVIEGVAEGFVARIIQHEVDHIDGILYTDRALEGTVLTLDEYRQMRKESMENGREDT